MVHEETQAPEEQIDGAALHLDRCHRCRFVPFALQSQPSRLQPPCHVLQAPGTTLPVQNLSAITACA